MAPAEAASQQLLKEQVASVLDSLTGRERCVLQLRFGPEDGRARSLDEVGQEFNLTRERIRVIEAKALSKLRHPSRSRKLRDYLVEAGSRAAAALPAFGGSTGHPWKTGRAAEWGFPSRSRRAECLDQAHALVDAIARRAPSRAPALTTPPPTSDTESGPASRRSPSAAPRPAVVRWRGSGTKAPRMTLDLHTLVLRSGAHTSPADGISLMEAVSNLAGEPWSNSPSCTSPVIAAYARSLNDWLPDAERQRLKRYIPRLVGTADPDLELRRAFACADAAVRVFAPLALAAAGLVEEAAMLSALAPVDRESAVLARSAALSAESAARSAASLSAWSAAESMRSAAESARSAARAVASAARSESAQAAGRLAAESARSAAESAAFDLLDRLITAAS